jgi:hypothetical protein
MKFIEVPKYNEDGSIETMVQVAPAEAQMLLQFAVNFMASVGRTTMVSVASKEQEDPDGINPLND